MSLKNCHWPIPLICGAILLVFPWPSFANGLKCATAVRLSNILNFDLKRAQLSAQRVKEKTNQIEMKVEYCKEMISFLESEQKVMDSSTGTVLAKNLISIHHLLNETYDSSDMSLRQLRDILANSYWLMTLGIRESGLGDSLIENFNFPKAIHDSIQSPTEFQSGLVAKRYAFKMSLQSTIDNAINFQNHARSGKIKLGTLNKIFLQLSSVNRFLMELLTERSIDPNFDIVDDLKTLKLIKDNIQITNLQELLKSLAQSKSGEDLAAMQSVLQETARLQTLILKLEKGPKSHLTLVN
jgi:hypothetical protein